MTEAKELDPAALEAAIKAMEHAHSLDAMLTCPDCKSGVVVVDYGEGPGGDVCPRCGGAGVITPPDWNPLKSAISSYIEALSTAPVALGAGWNTDLDAMPHALTLLFKAHDPDEPEGVVSLGIRGEEPQRLIAWSFLPSAIHPAPSRAVIDREQAANLAYRLCAETRHVTLGDSIAAALRSLPSNAPSLGEARLAEGEPVFTYTRTFNAIAAAVEWKPNNAFGISVRKFVEAFGPNPSHVQAEAGEAELAARMAVAYSISERAAP